MTGAARFEVVDPTDADALASVESYFAELDARFPQGFDGSVGHAALDAPRYRSPGGAFVVARIGDRTVGCGAVQTIEPGVGEIKRMWVDPSARGRRIGLGLLDALERSAASWAIARCGSTPTSTSPKRSPCTGERATSRSTATTTTRTRPTSSRSR